MLPEGGGGGGGKSRGAQPPRIGPRYAAALIALCLVAGSLATTLPPASAQTSEMLEVFVAARSSSITEGETAYFDFTRTGSTSDRVHILVLIEAAGVSLTNQATETGIVTFAAGRAETSIGLATADNLDTGPNGSVTVTIHSVYGSTAIIGPSAVVEVLDDELPEVTIEAQQTSITEGDDATFLVRRRGNDASPLTVTVSVTGGDNFLSERPTEVTIPAGSDSQQLTLATTSDANVYDDDTVTVTLTAAEGAAYSLGSPASALTGILELSATHTTVTIVGTQSRGWVDEGSDVEFTLTRGVQGSAFGLVVAVQVVTFSYDGGANIGHPSVKREVQNFEAVFYEDDVSTTLTVPAVDNKLNDGNRLVRATILPGIYRTFADSRRASVWVRDDDLPTVTLTVPSQDHTESDDSLPQFTVHRTWDEGDEEEYAEADVAQHDLVARVGRYGIRWFPDCPIAVDGVLYEGSILRGKTCEFGMGDIEERTEASLLPVDMPPMGDVLLYSTSTHFAPALVPSGESSHTHDVPLIRYVTALGGYVYIALQPFKCDVVPGNCGYRPQYEIGTPSDARVNVHNNSPGVRVESDQESVVEGEDITFTVSRYGGVPINARMALSVRVEVSQDGEFISGSTPQTVSFAAVEESEERDVEQTVTVSTTDDSIDEADGTVTLTILAPPETVVGEDATNYEPVGSDGASVGWYRTITVTVVPTMTIRRWRRASRRRPTASPRATTRRLLPSARTRWR